MSPLVLLAAAALGGLGSLLRYLVQTAPQRRGLPSPPWRILAVNVTASFLAGLAFSALPAPWQTLAVAGFCGGLSTWSTFMVDAAGLFRAGRAAAALALIAAHLGYGLLAAIAGVLLGARLLA